MRFDQKELSGGEGISIKTGVNLIDKEVKGSKVGKSLIIDTLRPNSESVSTTNKIHGSLLDEHKSQDIFEIKTMGYMSSGEYTDRRRQVVQQVFIDGIESIDEDSREELTASTPPLLEPMVKIENDIREGFILNLREMVSEVFVELKKKSSESCEDTLKRIAGEREKAAEYKRKVNLDVKKSVNFEQFDRAQENSFELMNGLLISQMEKGNRMKGILIDVLIFLDQQVLQLSKIQRMVLNNKIHSVRKFLEEQQDYISKFHSLPLPNTIIRC